MHKIYMWKMICSSDVDWNNHRILSDALKKIRHKLTKVQFLWTGNTILIITLQIIRPARYNL